MKKFVFLSLLFVMGAYVLIETINQKPSVSDLTLANVEALSYVNESSCNFNKVEKNEQKHELKCSGAGHQCCTLD